MDATADYAQVVRALTATNMPAYVAYALHSAAGFDALHSHETTAIVVRTKDGKIVKGTPPKLQIDSGKNYAGDILRHPPFDPTCYRASAATRATFELQEVEAIALQPTCQRVKRAAADKRDHTDDADFQTLYVEPATLRPIAVVGGNSEEYVKAKLDQRFTVVSGYVVPSKFTVKVIGSGPMFWLNVDAGETLSDIRFSATPP